MLAVVLALGGALAPAAAAVDLVASSAGLRIRPRQGRQPQLHANDLDWLQQALDRGPQDYGLHAARVSGSAS